MKRLEYKTRTGSKANSNKNSKSKVTKQKALKTKTVDIPKTDVAKKKMSYNKKNKRKKIKTVVFILVFLVFLIVSYLLFTLSTFDISNVEVIGTDRYKQEEVISKADVIIGRNIFWQMLKGVSKTVKELPYIKSAKLKATLPGKITIEITERTSKYFAYDKEKNIYYRIDDDGVIIEQVDIKDKTADELLTYGFIFDDEVVFATKIKDIDMDKLNVFKTILKEFEKSGINGSFTQVNFENSLTTATLNDKLNIIFPNDTNIKYNMSVLREIIAKIGEDATGFIDLTKSSPTYSSF